ncbi:hypothetical protein KQI61_04420 [Anaerocolumna aminovalerica]|uniref:hypothetical protein n=1 Tax=Anaerocolumna aminovalerica TaxID=1527 RepID=UPI001C0F2CA2|nr:hypothetical protein [Anaerocolumna aminovalerica]MBU5331432.1 hypothetical protein [Anaerocolumna aminovalerica]
MKKQYCYSWNDEIYHGRFDTEQEAIDHAKKDDEYAEYVYIGTCTEPKLRWCSNEEQIIESILDNLAEDMGEASESFEVNRTDELVLANMIDETVQRWISECEIKPSCYIVLDGHKVELI